MTDPKSRWPVWIVLALLLLTQYELHALTTGVDIIVSTRSDLTQYASASWREIQGIGYTVRTYRDPREESDVFVQRHEEAVRALAKILDKKPDAEEHRDQR